MKVQVYRRLTILYIYTVYIYIHVLCSLSSLRVVFLFLLRAAGICSCSVTFCLCWEVHLAITETRLFLASVQIQTVDFWPECCCFSHIYVVVPRFVYYLKRMERVTENFFYLMASIQSFATNLQKRLSHRWLILSKNSKALQDETNKQTERQLLFSVWVYCVATVGVFTLRKGADSNTSYLIFID